MTRSTRTASLLGAAAALVLGLTACGGSDSEYCDLLSSAEEDSALADADPSDPEALEDANDRVQEIIDAAPDDVKGDWETFQTALSDPEAAQEGDPTEALTALENIQQHAQDECDLELG